MFIDGVYKMFYVKSSCGRTDQSHRYGRPQAACREPAGSYDKTTRTAICFEHKNAISFNPCSIYSHCGILAHQ